MTDLTWREAFARQLDDPAVPVNTGDYLAGRTVEELVEERFISEFNRLVDPLTFEVRPVISKEQHRALVEEKVKEWADHAGEKLLFYLSYPVWASPQDLIQVKRCWEGEAAAIFAAHQPMDPLFTESGNIPRLRQI